MFKIYEVNNVGQKIKKKGLTKPIAIKESATESRILTTQSTLNLFVHTVANIFYLEAKLTQLNSTQRACTDAGVNTSMSASI